MIPTLLLIAVVALLLGGAWMARRMAHAQRRLMEAQAWSQAHVDALTADVQHLTAERDRLALALDRLAEGVILLDGEGRVLVLNPAAADLLGIRAPLRAGLRLTDLTGHPALHSVLDETHGATQPVTRTIAIFQPAERIVRACGLRRADGTLLILEDLTERQQYERLRKDLVANVSHELKSPLTAIRGLTETLLEGALADPANNRRFVGLIDEEALRLGRLIDDLLHLAQLESPVAPVAPRPVDVRQLVQELWPGWQAEAAKRRLTLTAALDDAPRVQADPDRLKQVFINLVDKAIKYNREGGTVRISAHPEGALLRISIEDTGIGIPEPDLPRVFERFYRVDKARSRALGGTGLGLSIVKHIVEAQGGTVAATSRHDQGSTFSFTLPLA